jgi:uncharacterized protein YdhG (YjbR/CyaY superfamily)
MAVHTANNTTFTDQEREAMKTRAKELAAENRANKKKADGEKDVMDAIAAMTGNDKSMAERIHSLVTETAPDLWPKTWYGMPAYAKDGNVVCFFQSAKRFEARYATFGFSDNAKLDDGNLWPTSFALAKMTPVEEEKIRELVKKAVG